jgi:hypothetical protein
LQHSTCQIDGAWKVASIDIAAGQCQIDDATKFVRRDAAWLFCRPIVRILDPIGRSRPRQCQYGRQRLFHPFWDPPAKRILRRRRRGLGSRQKGALRPAAKASLLIEQSGSFRPAIAAEIKYWCVFFATLWLSAR